MKDDFTPYQVLGVDKGATEDEINDAYRQLSKQYHPDRNIGDEVAAAHYQRVQEAYDAIGSPAARGEYDRTGKANAARGDSQIILTVISPVLLGVIQSADRSRGLEYVDVVARVRDELGRQHEEMCTDLNRMRQHEEKLEKVSARFTVNDENDNLLTTIVAAQLRGLRNAMADQKVRMDSHQKAITYLKGAKYKTDATEMRKLLAIPWTSSLP